MMEEVMLFHGGNVPVPRCVTAAVSFMLAVPAPSAEAGTLCSGPLSLSPRAGSQQHQVGSGPVSDPPVSPCLAQANSLTFEPWFPQASQVMLVGREPACQCRRFKRHQFNPWVGKIP